jgi:hypothetical protein
LIEQSEASTIAAQLAKAAGGSDIKGGALTDTMLRTHAYLDRDAAK